MITEIAFDNWRQLEMYALKTAEDETHPPDNGELTPYYSRPVFRGQADADWSLGTTLERSRFRTDRLSFYMRAVLQAQPAIESLIDAKWSKSDILAEFARAETYDGFRASNLELIECFAHLRHIGFPSPLLDWTRSLYVAAFFAYRNPPPNAKRVAVYMFQEHRGGGKYWSSKDAQIHTVGHSLRTHKRHHLQQGEYTMSVKWSADPLGWFFVPHDDAFAREHTLLTEQDRLWKFTAPAEEGPSVLAHLDRFNLNAFSLFQSDDALMETMASRVLPLHPT